jgi:arginyl-tRNA synthetase
MLPAHKQTLEALLADSVAQVAHALKGADAEFVIPAITLERPKVAAHGDVACNVAMQLAKPLGTNPRELAERSSRRWSPAGRARAGRRGGDRRPRLHQPAPERRRQAGRGRRRARAGPRVRHVGAASGKRVLVEFVSANPTGPLHVGHGRQAALGDALANVFASQGYAVHREFYYNDAGVQIANAGHLGAGARAA